jgi:hypothetical protein
MTDAVVSTIRERDGRALEVFGEHDRRSHLWGCLMLPDGQPALPQGAH